MSESTIRLDRLAQLASITPRSLLRWFSAGMIRGVNHGRGPGNGIVLSRDGATEALALLALRNAGVPRQRLRIVAREMRKTSGTDATFLALGARGSVSLLSGRGDSTPPAKAKDRHTFLGVVLDLRPLRADVTRLVQELEREVAKQQRPPRAAIAKASAA